MYAESLDGVGWAWNTTAGIMWPPNATEQTQSDILRLVEAGAAVFQDTNPAARAESDADWTIKLVGQLTPLKAQADKVMHNGGNGDYLVSRDGVHFDGLPGVGRVDVDGGRTPGARRGGIPKTTSSSIIARSATSVRCARHATRAVEYGGRRA